MQVGVGVVVLRHGRVLIGRRLGPHGRDTWGLPGGHLEFGESPADCARRELREETGLEARALHPGPATSDVFPAEPGRAPRHFVTLFIRAEVDLSATPQRLEPDRCAGWQWCDWLALPQPLFAPLRSLLAQGLPPGWGPSAPDPAGDGVSVAGDSAIDTPEDVLRLLDGWLQPDAQPSARPPAVAAAGPGIGAVGTDTDSGAEAAERARWDRFFADRARPCPFFHAGPDEHLAAAFAPPGAGPAPDGVRLPPTGVALDLGCGAGRHAVFLARQGWRVVAVDLSPVALAWADERVRAAGVADRVALQQAALRALVLPAGGFDLVVDAGCFHHLAPHRRAGHVAAVARWLRPGGWLCLSAFTPEGGSGLDDRQVYQRRSLGGGLGYTADRLRAIWGGPLTVAALRPMRQPAPAEGLFGAPFLWAMWARRPVDGMAPAGAVGAAEPGVPDGASVHTAL